MNPEMSGNQPARAYRPAMVEYPADKRIFEVRTLGLLPVAASLGEALVSVATRFTDTSVRANGHLAKSFLLRTSDNFEDQVNLDDPYYATPADRVHAVADILDKVEASVRVGVGVQLLVFLPSRGQWEACETISVWL